MVEAPNLTLLHLGVVERLPEDALRAPEKRPDVLPARPRRETGRCVTGENPAEALPMLGTVERGKPLRKLKAEGEWIARLANELSASRVERRALDLDA